MARVQNINVCTWQALLAFGKRDVHTNIAWTDTEKKSKKGLFRCGISNFESSDSGLKFTLFL